MGREALPVRVSPVESTTVATTVKSSTREGFSPFWGSGSAGNATWKRPFSSLTVSPEQISRGGEGGLHPQKDQGRRVSRRTVYFTGR